MVGRLVVVRLSGVVSRLADVVGGLGRVNGRLISVVDTLTDAWTCWQV